MKFGTCLCSLLLAGSLPAAEIVITTNRAFTNSSAPISALRTNAFKGIQVKKGFRLELVASEPLTVNPGAMAFDENGRLFVLETPDGQPGRVRLLEDTDGDGAFDSSSVYADGVYGASALACYGGGVFVGAGTEIFYFKDTKGDNRADTRNVVFNGFGDATNGASGVVTFSAMIWGLDNRIHVATSGRGGDIISSSSPKQSVVLSAGCFSFDPRTFGLMDESGSGAGGMSFDNRGRRFVASPVNHLQRVMYESRYATRNPFWQMPGALVDLGSANVVYPAGDGQPLPVRFFAASGLTFYRGYLFPLEYVDNPFIADKSAGVVHRDKLKANGFELTAERAPDESRSEFLTVSDNSFQPVAFANGPEGALYVAGTAREAAVSSAVKNLKTNASAARGFGRIYRIMPATFKPSPPARLGQLAATNLVNTLRHSDGWHRDTAARLLYERQDKAAIVPVIQLLFDPRSPPLARVYALHALDGLQTLVPGHIIRSLGDADERVREHAVLLSEKLLTNGMTMPDAVWGQLTKMPGDPSPQVRYQLAFTLGQCRNPGRSQALADTLRSDAASPWMQSAVMSSLGEGAGEMLGLLATDGNFRSSAPGREFIGRLAMVIGAKNQPDEVTQAMRVIAGIPEAETACLAARKLGDGLQSAKSSLAIADPQHILQPVYATAARFTMDLNAPEGTRVQAMRLLDVSTLWDTQMNTVMVQQWPALSPRLRNELVCALFSRPDRLGALLYGLDTAMIPRTGLSSFQIQFLVAYPNQIMSHDMAIVLGKPAVPSRQNVVNQYASAAQMAGARERGRTLFIARCGDCHQSGSTGDPSGMVLKNLMEMGREKLLAKIIDPNRDLITKNNALLMIAPDKTVLTGNIIRENADSIVLCQPNGELRILAKANLQSQTTFPISAMPEQLEAGLNQQDMADLLEFLCPIPPP